jgi:hypothetical protein
MADPPNSYEEYRERVDMLAGVIVEEYDEADDPDVHGLVHQSVDSSRLITHTPAITLRYYDNEPDQFRHLIDDGDNFRRHLQALAFAALRSDVYEELRKRDVL